jgi:hypothetical protein
MGNKETKKGQSFDQLKILKETKRQVEDQSNDSSDKTNKLKISIMEVQGKT